MLSFSSAHVSEGEAGAVTVLAMAVVMLVLAVVVVVVQVVRGIKRSANASDLARRVARSLLSN
jgi:Na+-transporting methylmalonyl-CoA/oxaloacetate decarboxylase gamma subunit